MKTVRFLIESSADFLQKHQITSPKRCAEELLASVLKKKRMDLFMDYDAPVTQQEVDAYRALIVRKKAGEPLGYLLEEQEFLGCRLRLTSAVLIPRQETEILVHFALKEIGDEPKVLWDVCCGTGCMGLAAKKHRSNLEVRLSDVSKEALECAKENAKQNTLDVTFLEGDLLAPFEGQKADYVFCNPPYISEKEYATLEKEVHFEPKGALVAEKEGLLFYERLAKELPSHLNDGAKIFLEIGESQGEDLKRLFNQPHWKETRCEKDWAGKDRFFFLEFQ